ncbi:MULTISPECIES: amidohydrolase [unclassified Thiocapsa]|uniref:amidohydrolase n=1 Tax=unclassified Thiocapsa TaxID=2641286 RepID=UPI0035B15673
MKTFDSDGITRREFIATSATASLMLSASPYLQADPKPRSKTLFINGAIYIDSDHRVDNLLIRDGIVAGINVNPARHLDAQQIDLAGAAVYPGFNDSHVHLITMAVAGSILVPTPGEEDPLRIAELVGTQCEKQEPGTPVMGHGFKLEDFGAWSLGDLAEIDALTGDQCPVMIADQLGHSYIVNSVAMRMSGLGDDTSDPPGGVIVRENGKATGMLRETAGAIVGNAAIFPGVSDDRVKPYAVGLLNQWAKMGYTSIVDLMGGPMGRTMEAELCRELDLEGLLPLRINYAYTFFSLDDMMDFRQTEQSSPMVRFAGLKLFVDGAAGQGGAWTSWKNTQGNHGLHAIWINDKRYGKQYNIYRILEESEKHGLDMHYHVGGDLAINAVLSAIEAVQKKSGRLRGKHTLYHLGLITDKQIARMSALGESVIAGVQPSLHWEFQKEETAFYYGEHARGSYPYRKLRDAGVTLAFSTDYASNIPDLCWPTEIMRIALTGAGEPEANPPLTMRDLIEGFTVGGYATTRETRIGKLYPGYKADIVIYEKDLYEVAPENLSKDYPRVLATWVGGRQVVTI